MPQRRVGQVDADAEIGIAETVAFNAAILCRLAKVDADSETDIAEKFKVQAFPTFKILCESS